MTEPECGWVQFLPPPVTGPFLRHHFCGRHSEIFEYDLQAAGRAMQVVVKHTTQFSSISTARAALRSEFEAIRGLKLSLPPGLARTLPEPLALDEPGLALVLGKLPGRPLAELMRQQGNILVAPLRQNAVHSRMRLAGDWLARFHAATAAPSLTFAAQDFHQGMVALLHRCRTGGLPEAAAERLDALCARACDALRDQSLPAAARHGDFLPQNLLGGSADMAVVDFQNFSPRAAVYEDLSTFLAHVALLRCPPYSARLMRTSAARFLEAYQNSAASAADPVLRHFNSAMLNLHIAAAGLLTLAEAPASPAKAPSRRMTGLQHRLLRLCEERLRAMPEPAPPHDTLPHVNRRINGQGDAPPL